MIDDGTYTYLVAGVANLPIHANPDLPEYHSSTTAILRFDPHVNPDHSFTGMMYGPHRFTYEADAEFPDAGQPTPKPVQRPVSDPNDLLEVGPGVRWCEAGPTLKDRKWMVLFPLYRDDLDDDPLMMD